MHGQWGAKQYIRELYIASVYISPHLHNEIVSDGNQFSALFSVSRILSVTIHCWPPGAGHVLTLCRCQPWHNDNIKLCHPAPGTWEYDDPSIMYSACIYIFTPFTTLLRLSVATMSWSFRTFVNKGNVRIIITQMLEWKQRSRWIHAHVSRFLFIVLWIIKRLTPPKYQSH